MQRKIDSKGGSNKGEKLPVAEPATVGKFAIILLMYICKKILLVDTMTKVGLYVSVVTVGSLLADLFRFPKWYFSNTNNLFNQYFVKLSWGWTFTLVGLFIILTSTVNHCGDRRRISRHLSRLAVGTFIWFVCTKSFVYIQRNTGSCPKAEITDMTDCYKAGYEWLGFDISGHTFLLMYCLLLISEEVKIFAGWEKIPDSIQKEENAPTRRISDFDLSQMKELYDRTLPFVRLSVVLLTLISLIWEVMLLATIIYFHNLPQKVLAAIIAVTAWFLTYRVWYTFPLSPGLPVQGIIKYSAKQ